MFEKGKWYKNLGSCFNYIAPFVDIQNNAWKNDKNKGYIYKGIFESSDVPFLTTNFEKAQEISLQEIQKYLPDNHPDKIKVTQDEFKVGDWVIATIGYVEYLVKLTRLNPPGGLFKVLKSGGKLTSDGSFEKIVRKAKLEEIPVEDLSNEEILEIAKQYYPIGTKFKNAKGEDKVYIVNDDLSNPNKNQWFFRSTGNKALVIYVKDNEGNEVKYYGKYILYQGKWAEIISTSQEVKDDFVLPEKWYVVVTKENIDIVAKWRFSFGIPIQFQEGCIAGFCKSSTTKEWDKKVTSNWINEITTEQFKKYVLGEKIEKKSEELERWLIKGEEDKFIKPQDTNEIYISTITKQKKKIDYTINSVFADIKINLPEKPKKIVKPIVLEKFNLII